MREILFRGRNLSGQWHYGVPLMLNEDYVCISKLHEYNKTVEYKTLGQYTGSTDKNGTKIFEGDIIIYGFKPCVVKWDNINACFSLYENGKTQISGFNADTMKLLEIIGNIYDNPELLKEA